MRQVSFIPRGGKLQNLHARLTMPLGTKVIPGGDLVLGSVKTSIDTGSAKCQRKGHRPPNKSGVCTRCNHGPESPA